MPLTKPLGASSPISIVPRNHIRSVCAALIWTIWFFGTFWVAPAAGQKTPATLHSLLADLATGNAAVAFKAARAIGALAHDGQDCTAAIPLLLEHLNDLRQVQIVRGGDQPYASEVHYTVESALVAIGKPAVEPLIRMVAGLPLRSGRIGDFKAIRILGKIGDARAMTVLLRHVHRRGSDFRHTAMKAVAKIGGEEAWMSLVEVLDSEAGKTRLVAAEGLASMDAVKAAPFIAAHIDAMLAEPEVRIAAVNLVQKCRIKAAAPRLVDLLYDEDKLVVRRAAGALGEVSVPAKALSRLVELSGQKYYNEIATKAIAAIEDPEALDALLVLIDDRDPGMRRAAVIALGNLKAPESVPPLYARLNDPDDGVRWQAMNALKKTPGPEALQAMVLATANENVKVGRMAENALRSRRDPDSAPAVLGMLGHPDPRIRENAALVLAQGPGTPQIEDDLLQALNDQDPTVRVAVGQALIKVGTRRAFIPLVRALHCELSLANHHGLDSPSASFCQALSALGGSLYSHDGEKWLKWALGKMTEVGSRDPDRLLAVDHVAMSNEMHRYRSITEEAVRERALLLLQDSSVDKRRAGVIVLGIIAAREDLARLQTLESSDPGLESDIRMALAWMEKDGRPWSDGQGAPENHFTPDWVLAPALTATPAEKRSDNSGGTVMQADPVPASPPAIDFEVTMILPGDRARALIGGNMVRVGDQVGSWTVKAIEAGAVTITCDGHDEVLGLSK